MFFMRKASVAESRQQTSGAGEADAGRHGPPRFVVSLLIIALSGGLALAWFFGREACGDAWGVVSLARESGRLPHWFPYGVAGAAVALAIVSTAYLTFGRNRALKAACLAIVVAVLAVPGLALGWTSATVATMGNRSPEVKKTVARTRNELKHPLPGKALNVLLLGSDHAGAGDPGRSDSQILVRLDPEAKTISMLSLPRDLRTYIPGVGYDKMNAAYAYGGVPLAVKVFKRITGLPVNHFVRIDFAGFWQVVDILGGVYLPIDHRYYVPESADYKSIDLQPGYQLVRAKQSLNFVRYRHDQKGDFTRMVRQQMFLREVQRQSTRWSGDWSRIIRMAKAISGQTTTDLDSLKQILPIVSMALTLDASHVLTVHVEGSTPMIGGVSYVVASREQIASAVAKFQHPARAASASSRPLPKSSYRVRVIGARGSQNVAGRMAKELRRRGYMAAAVAGSEGAQATTVISAARSLSAPARTLARLLSPARVELTRSTHGFADTIHVVLGMLSARSLQEQASASTAIETARRHDWSAWKALGKETPLKLEAPTDWSPGLAYDQFRAYRVRTTDDRRVAAAIVVGTYGSGSWGVQAMRWTDPPAIADPASVQTVGERSYMLFYQGKHLHMVAWKENGALYWVVNTLEDELPNDLILALATSCRIVGE